MSGQNAIEGVGGAEHQFHQVGARRGAGYFRSQRILQFMSDLAEFAETDRRRIALERMHGAANAAHDLRILWGLLQAECFLVQSLQDLLRALKKELAQFHHAVVGEEVQAFTSTRW